MNMRVERMLSTITLPLQAMDFTTFLLGTVGRLDARAFHLRPARVQNQHRDIAVDGRHHGGRMQNLRAEIGQLGGFGERDHFHAMRVGNDGRIGGQHAVHVGPDLDFFGANARADDGRREIGPAAAERGGDAIFGGCDEAAHHYHVLLRPAEEWRRRAWRRSGRTSGTACVWR